jgi:hypothetical protein
MFMTCASYHSRRGGQSWRADSGHFADCGRSADSTGTGRQLFACFAFETRFFQWKLQGLPYDGHGCGYN